MTGDGDDTDIRASKQRGLVPFKPGQSGNPDGRPKGPATSSARAS